MLLDAAAALKAAKLAASALIGVLMVFQR